MSINTLIGLSLDITLTVDIPSQYNTKCVIPLRSFGHSSKQSPMETTPHISQIEGAKKK